ncbi:MAG: helix-turn-helix transcriptional regulator [Candidatus Gastranaerophilales bacterium]|nr:helix-turn-helix transcriptional regulator [Candidatus Gastranaerophilales bacterium]
MARQRDDYQRESIQLVFGANIRRSRETREMTKVELAYKAEYDRISLLRLEQGRRNVNLNTALKLARALNVPFPDLFSRNFMTNLIKNELCFTDSFSEDDYLLVFVENFRKRMRYLRKDQALAYIETGISESHVSHIVQGKYTNPSIRTLDALAYTADADLCDLFSRTSSPKI